MVKWTNPLSKYSILHQIGLGKCQGKEIIEAKEFLIQEFTGDEEVRDSEIVARLWRIYKSESPEQRLAEVCLRCVISHYIKIQCQDFAQQYGDKHNFTVEDLLPLVLDSTDSSLNHGSNDSLTVRILETFNLEKSSLSAWIKIVVRSDKELKRFLLQHGIEQVTDWLLLKQYNTRQLQRILSEFHHYSSTKIQQLSRLLESYQTVYLAEIQAARNQINQERKQQGLGKIKTPYPAPNHQQLLSMAEELLPTWELSAEEVLEELQNIAQLIRDYKSSRARGITKPSQGKSTTNLPANNSDEDEQENEILTRYRQFLQDCLITAIKEITEERINYLQSKRNKRDKQFLQGLHLFHCQSLAMGEIAHKLGLNNQSQVSRFLELKAFRSDIGRRTLVKLRSKVIELAQAYASPTQLRSLEEKIKYFLDEEIENVIQEAEKEANISKNRVITSKLSVAICQYLDTRKEIK